MAEIKASDIQALKSKKSHQFSEEDWEGQGDARSLMRAELIKADPKRLKQAQLWAAVLVDQEKDEAEAMQKVAKS